MPAIFYIEVRFATLNTAKTFESITAYVYSSQFKPDVPVSTAEDCDVYMTNAKLSPGDA